MQTFVTQQWKHQSEEKLNSLHNKNKNKKKVKSPLHIFSTLRRSPSYPPPGCVKSKKNLKPEQDGVSKSHRLLGQTCSSTVKQQVEAEVPGTKTTHRLLGQSLSSTDPRLDHGGGPCPGPLPLKPRRILGRPCSALVKPEDLRPTPHKLLPRLCSGDPRCEHAGGGGGSLGGGLKHHRLLSRSCSGSIRTEELDGLKHHHHLLSRSYSSSTKMGKAADIFKDSVSPSEGRRLSLTSGLMGILAPSLPNNGAKSIPIRDRGFLVQTMEYAEQRTPVLNEFCVVCDEPHVFQNGPMLRPTVCERELCVFAFQTLGVMNEAADEIATGAQKKDYDRVMRALDSLTSIREMSQAPYLEVKRQMDKHDPLAHPLLQWVISSNRSHIVKLPVTRQLKFMHTPHQFLLLNSPPAKESNFRAAKNLFGSTFAFHGSHIENWHSILRNGLVVASNTRLQLHGAIYGSGIYLSPMSSISFGYSGILSLGWSNTRWLGKTP
uniref:Poly [ADP-ribose] polymerase n=1 Tax=Oncorhynchus mykiss TaxID=8022 RepID=A0A8C7SND4_ONCMY